MRDSQPHPPVSTWSVTVHPPVQGDARWRAQTLESIRPEVERHVRSAPAERQFLLKSPLLQVAVRHEAGEWHPGTELRLRYADSPLPHSLDRKSDPMPALPARTLPHEPLQRLGERLVGLDRMRDEVLLRLQCCWHGRLETWGSGAGWPLSPAVRAAFAERPPLFIFTGDPGLGKSALAQVIADRYCRAAGVSGHLFLLGTSLRGNGLVGNFGNQVRSAFEAVSRLSAPDTPCFIVIDEADAVAMRRSEAHAHQEDRAGTATLLQCLDSLTPHQRVATILTTNLPETVDAAVRRRGILYSFRRPDYRARRALLAQLLPQASAPFLAAAAVVANGMTPADIERAVMQAHLKAIAAHVPLRWSGVLKHLRRMPRTGRV